MGVGVPGILGRPHQGVRAPSTEGELEEEPRSSLARVLAPFTGLLILFGGWEAGLSSWCGAHRGSEGRPVASAALLSEARSLAV